MPRVATSENTPAPNALRNAIMAKDGLADFTKIWQRITPLERLKLLVTCPMSHNRYLCGVVAFAAQCGVLEILECIREFRESNANEQQAYDAALRDVVRNSHQFSYYSYVQEDGKSRHHGSEKGEFTPLEWMLRTMRWPSGYYHAGLTEVIAILQQMAGDNIWTETAKTLLRDYQGKMTRKASPEHQQEYAALIAMIAASEVTEQVEKLVVVAAESDAEESVDGPASKRRRIENAATSSPGASDSTLSASDVDDTLGENPFAAFAGIAALSERIPSGGSTSPAATVAVPSLSQTPQPGAFQPFTPAPPATNMALVQPPMYLPMGGEMLPYGLPYPPMYGAPYPMYGAPYPMYGQPMPYPPYEGYMPMQPTMLTLAQMDWLRHMPTTYTVTPSALPVDQPPTYSLPQLSFVQRTSPNEYVKGGGI
jgi:hypothetical protein